MRYRSTGYRNAEDHTFESDASLHRHENVSDSNTNSADEVIGEMGLVLVVILGIVVAINVVLTSLHIG